MGPVNSRHIHGNCTITRKKSQSVEEGTPHPLLIELILDKIFGYVIGSPPINPSAYRDAQRVRLVCRVWRDRATILFRQLRSPTRFNQVSNPKRSQAAMLKRYLRIMEYSTLMPVERYIIQTGIFSRLSPRLVEDFGAVCLPDATQLRLDFKDFDSLHFTLELNFTLTLPRLGALEIRCDERKQRRKRVAPQFKEIQGIPPLLEMLLKSAINLNLFTFHVVDFDQEKSENIFMEICKHIPKSTRKINLRFGQPSDLDPYLSSLTECNLKLVEISFTFADVIVSGEVVLEFFQLQSPTLETLLLHGNSASLIISDFPKLPQLLSLRLSGYSTLPISLPQTFPNLTVLNLMDLEAEAELMRLVSRPEKMESVVELSLPYDFPQKQVMSEVSKCFPNVKTLFISPPFDTFEENMLGVFTYYEDIKELSIRFPTEVVSGDSILSGVHADDCWSILKEDNFSEMDIQTFQCNPSLLNLTKLKKLVLVCTRFDTVIITDFAVYFVFLKMASLEEVHSNCIETCEAKSVYTRQMTQDCYHLLRGKLKVFDPYYLFRHSEDETSSSDERDCPYYSDESLYSPEPTRRDSWS